MDPNLTNWPTIHEAAAALRTSTRSVLRRNEEGTLEIRKRERPRKKPENVVNPDDLKKLIEKEAPRPFPVTHINIPERQKPQFPPEAPTYPPGLDEFINAIVSAARARPDPPQLPPPAEPAIARPAPPAVPLHLKLWLTLEEAAAYSGYSESELRQAIAAGSVKANRGGPRRAWIISRASLESFNA